MPQMLWSNVLSVINPLEFLIGFLSLGKNIAYAKNAMK